MRIRKHAKISQLVDAASPLPDGAVLQTYICQLNQSPWDTMSFSPPSSPLPPSPEAAPPPQVDGGDASGGNSSSDQRISVGESKKLPNIDATLAKEQCCKNDGKSWRCRREAAAGSSLCDHHLSLVKNYQNLGHNTNKKPENSSVEKRRSTRSKIDSWSLDSHEFYYYSGFRPGWSKKRSGVNSNNGGSAASSSRVQNNIEELIDSDEDDDDEDEEEYQTAAAVGEKRRPRKPVKARSLKSLM